MSVLGPINDTILSVGQEICPVRSQSIGNAAVITTRREELIKHEKIETAFYSVSRKKCVFDKLLRGFDIFACVIHL